MAVDRNAVIKLHKKGKSKVEAAKWLNMKDRVEVSGNQKTP